MKPTTAPRRRLVGGGHILKLIMSNKLNWISSLRILYDRADDHNFEGMHEKLDILFKAVMCLSEEVLILSNDLKKGTEGKGRRLP